MQKKLLKSANIWQSYSKNKSGPVFLTHSVFAPSSIRIPSQSEEISRHAK